MARERETEEEKESGRKSRGERLRETDRQRKIGERERERERGGGEEGERERERQALTRNLFCFMLNNKVIKQYKEASLVARILSNLNIYKSYTIYNSRTTSIKLKPYSLSHPQNYTRVTKSERSK